MSNKRDYNETIRDISLLYELSLSVGKSLDVKINCDVFLKTLMSRKNLTYVSVWIKNEYFADEKDKCVTLIYANPSFRVREKYLRLNHPIFSLLQENDAVSISSTGDRFPEIITEKGIVKGTFAIFALGDIGILKLFSIAKESPFEERES